MFRAALLVVSCVLRRVSRGLVDTAAAGTVKQAACVVDNFPSIKMSSMAAWLSQGDRMAISMTLGVQTLACKHWRANAVDPDIFLWPSILTG